MGVEHDDDDRRLARDLRGRRELELMADAFVDAVDDAARAARPGAVIQLGGNAAVEAARGLLQDAFLRRKLAELRGPGSRS